MSTFSVSYTLGNYETCLFTFGKLNYEVPYVDRIYQPNDKIIIGTCTFSTYEQSFIYNIKLEKIFVDNFEIGSWDEVKFYPNICNADCNCLPEGTYGLHAHHNDICLQGCKRNNDEIIYSALFFTNNYYEIMANKSCSKRFTSGAL